MSARMGLHEIEDLHDAAEYLANSGHDRFAGAVSEAACLLEKNTACFVCGGDGVFEANGKMVDCENCKLEELKKVFEALFKIASYQRGGIIPESGPVFERDEMIGLARSALGKKFLLSRRTTP